MMNFDPQSEPLSWPDVTGRRMFGADCLLAKGRMFTFFIEDGVVVKLPEDRYQRALELPGVEPFTMRGAPFGKWAKFSPDEAFGLLAWLHVAYEHVLSEPAPKRRAKKGGKRRLTPRKR